MHGRLLITFSLLFFGLFLVPSQVLAQNFDTYIWQKNAPKNLNQGEINTQKLELQKEIAAILAKGPLAPLRLSYADVDYEGYWYYLERGRIITTLAYAYPYVTTQQQQQIKTYVQTHLSSGKEAPWTTKTKANGEGDDRNYHGFNITDGRFPRDFVIAPNVNIANTPVLHVIYGLWLYGDRTGDWPTIQTYWTQIKTFYNNNKNTHILYGQMGGHIAMARLAARFNDSAMQATAISDINSHLTTGLNQATIETRQQGTIYNFFNCTRCGGFFPGQPWMFLDSSPEIWRYLKDNLSQTTINRINLFENRYPNWWLARFPSFTRWTGDEGQGITSEPMGMLFPAERWLKNTSISQLENFMSSAPTSIGDSFWIEALVTTIEAHAQTCWINVITGQEVTCEAAPITPTSTPGGPTNTPTSQASPTPTPKPGDCEPDGGDSDIDIFDYNRLVSNFGSSTNLSCDFVNLGSIDIFDYNTVVSNFGK